ncbi:MAG TPA: hypothetical protein VFY16_00160 [Gemmatimonadaceae bacterium]|nr:hypothetical protein [Gemmatimonadaceae bacterium]
MADRHEPNPHVQPRHEPGTAAHRAVARADDDSSLRAEELQRNMVEGRARLAERGVHLGGDESSEELVEMLEAVERFETQVERHGGDLMVDTGAAREPDDRHFVLPKREAGERAGVYARRIEEAAARLREHPPIA